MLRGLLDRLVLLVGTIAGGCVPGFIQQYRQRVGGRLDQVMQDLAPFEEIARRFHDGDMQKLVRHHLASTDPSFHAEGQALQQMIDSLAHLTALAQGLTGTIWQQIGFMMRHYDAEIGAATWSDHVPVFSLDPGSIAVALTVGVALWAAFHLVWWALSWLVMIIAAKTVRRPPALR